MFICEEEGEGEGEEVEEVVEEISQARTARGTDFFKRLASLATNSR